ncbi:MAG TPA: hypothetical protein VK856_02150, partial [Anaerolineaceae bacterium]|nr:hypothetical protein [Anaerolineaceae bacterium]
QFWNLDGVEIDQETRKDQVNQTNDNPTWVTEFVNPVIDFVENRSPDIEDNFDTATNTWKLTADYNSDWKISFEEGEMILIGQAKNTLATYFDYVAEVELRRVSGIGRQGISWDNGSAIGCEFKVDNGQHV